MTTPLDVISGALRSIGALESGETPDPQTANDHFNTLNDLLASWSNSKMMVHYATEIVFPLVPGQYQYTIGPGGQVGATFTGSISGFVLTVTSIATGAIAIGQTITGAGIAAGTVISSFLSGAGQNASGALGTYTLNTSNTFVSGAIAATNPRPLAIRSGFVRVSQIDYPVDVLSVGDYEQIGLKVLNSSWPRAVYYQPSLPLGNLTFWPVPSQGEIHLYADTILGGFNTLADVIQLPQGYNLAMRYGLAELLIPEYGSASQSQVQMVTDLAAQGRALIKRSNMRPQQTVRLDSMLRGSNHVSDASFILSGGFS